MVKNFVQLYLSQFLSVRQAAHTKMRPAKSRSRYFEDGDGAAVGRGKTCPRAYPTEVLLSATAGPTGGRNPAASGLARDSIRSKK